MRTTWTSSEPRRSLWRSRWAAIGAAVAVTLGGGGLFVANAATGAPSAVVTIDPVRVLDTRTDVGLAGPFVSAVSQKLQITGAAVPAGATGVLLNVTVVSPTAAGFLSVRPGDAAGAPSTSSLNFTAGDIVPNAVQVALPTTGPNAGQIDITYDAFGVAGPTTEVLADVVGYMVAGGAAAGPVGPAGPSGMSFIATYGFNADTPISESLGPPSPVGYSATVGLAAGRYSVTGDLSVSNRDNYAGNVFCRTHVNNTPVGNSAAQSIMPKGFGNLAISSTFMLPTGGSTIVDYRCYREVPGLNIPPLIVYLRGNMTIYKVG